jgi:hypothetical protein
MVKFLHQPKDWVVADPKPVTVDGVSGVAVDAVTGPKARGGLLTFPEDAFNTDPKEKIRWIILDRTARRSSSCSILSRKQASTLSAHGSNR